MHVGRGAAVPRPSMLLVTIPQGKIGLYARDGEALPPSQTSDAFVTGNKFQTPRLLGQPQQQGENGPGRRTQRALLREGVYASTPPCRRHHRDQVYGLRHLRPSARRGTQHLARPQLSEIDGFDPEGSAARADERPAPPESRIQVDSAPCAGSRRPLAGPRRGSIAPGVGMALSDPTTTTTPGIRSLLRADGRRGRQ